MPVGRPTRGTTNTNRLRRIDRWIAQHPAFRGAERPLVVDLGYGASGATAFELFDRLRPTRDTVRVVGLEIDPERVATARAQLEQQAPLTQERVSFARGGFEVPLARGERANVIRAFNVLRQYDEAEVPDAWALMLDRLVPDGLLVEGTCSEIGRVASWIGLRPSGPETFTVSLHLGSLELPSIAAERLPKALIHRNIPGERIHDFLRAFDAAWLKEAPRATFSAQQRFIATVQRLRTEGWPLLDDVKRWRLGEVTLPWHAVAPRDGGVAERWPAASR